MEYGFWKYDTFWTIGKLASNDDLVDYSTGVQI